VDRFRHRAGKGLARVTLADLQEFANTLGELLAASRYRCLSSIKLLLAFGHRIGYLPFDVGRVLRLPSVRNSLAERILPEADLHRMLSLEPDERNRVLLLLLYASGVRRGELAGLRWQDLQATSDGGQITVFGKGGKTRSVQLPVSVWKQLSKLRGVAEAHEPVFPSRKGGEPLTDSGIWRIVKAAARRADIEVPVSPHWLRHAHASHALDRGHPFTWCKRRWAMPVLPPRVGTSMPAPRKAPASSCRSNSVRKLSCQRRMKAAWPAPSSMSAA
jgi:integrase/recombinase XerD